MPIVKEDLILGDGSVLDPVKGEPYIRLARVEEVRLFSQEMIIQFVDGDYDEETQLPIEPPETAVAVIGSPVPETTYNPSCTVYGKGDMVNVLVGLQGTNYTVSLMDMYIDVNRENFALCEGWALYDILNGVLVDCLDDDENSYLTFRSRIPNEFLEYEVTKITGDPNKRYVMRRMLDYFMGMMTQQMNLTAQDDPFWNWTQNSCGPDNNPMRHIHDRLHKGKRVCGFPYVEDVDFTNDGATLANDIVMYHSTLTDLKTADIHPLSAGNVLSRYFENATVIWWDDEEPTHVVVIGSYPAWSVCKYIVFAEVPVYSMSGRKFLEREIIDEDLPTEERNTIQSWQLYADQVRVLKVIDRSTYVDFPAHESDVEFVDHIQKNVAAYLPTQPESDIKDFGMLDGYGWGQSGTVFDVNKVKKMVGTIERTVKEIDDATEPNGSRYEYEILHNDPLTTGNLDLSYSTRFEYFHDSAATPPTWERQTPNAPTKEFSCYVDGVNYMERTCDFDYYCEGWFDDTEPIMGRIGWSDGGGLWASEAQNFDNEVWHKTYRNGGHLFTDHFWLTKTGNTYAGGETKYILMYADVEYDLFVFLKIETHIDSHAGLGPGWTFLESLGTHYNRHSGIVMFEGTEWTIWTYFIPLVDFPTLYNFHPWLSDVGSPERPDTPPCADYSSDTNHTGYYFHEPEFYPWSGTLKPGYSTAGSGYPGPFFGPSSLPTWQIIKTYDDPTSFTDPDDLLQVSIDYENDSFCVKFESFYISDVPNSKVLSYPNGGNTLCSFEGELPHFTVPTETRTIEL